MTEANDIDDKNPLDFIVDEDGVITEPPDLKAFRELVVSINDFPEYVEESKNENILIKGRWLERGGSAWWISTAGTGKSIASIQIAYKWGAGLPFAGLTPHRPLRTWIIQSEDSPSRITIDREDIVAQLKEDFPEIDWPVVGRNCVKFVKFSGKFGVKFIKALDDTLARANKLNQKPDVIILNPFMAFIGGPVTDGGYVTPFLRGGEIDHEHTDGFQHILESHNVAALIFHHTPKPPTDKELDGWLKSMFPEYQGAGSSDITNWGRSFITMMKVRNHSKMVCLMAGKNGGEIGWDEIGDSRRHYLAWSNGIGITGGRRHAWRELTDEEKESVLGADKVNRSLEVETNAWRMVEELKQTAMTATEIEKHFTKKFNQRMYRDAWRLIKDNMDKFKVKIKPVWIGDEKIQYTLVGLESGIIARKRLLQEEYEINKLKSK